MKMWEKVKLVPVSGMSGAADMREAEVAADGLNNRKLCGKVINKSVLWKRSGEILPGLSMLKREVKQPLRKRCQNNII